MEERLPRGTYIMPFRREQSSTRGLQVIFPVGKAIKCFLYSFYPLSSLCHKKGVSGSSWFRSRALIPVYFRSLKREKHSPACFNAEVLLEVQLDGCQEIL